MRTAPFHAAVALLMAAAPVPAPSADAALRVRADRPGARISPTLFGIFFEDINLGADGGLYAELVKNRGFEFPDPLLGWKKVVEGAGSSVEVRDDGGFTAASPHYARLIPGADGAAGLANEGFHGIGVRAGETYLFSVRVRSAGGEADLRVALAAGDGRELAAARIGGFAREWARRDVALRPVATEGRAHLELRASGGALDVDFVSLFPRGTWKGRPGGLRADLVGMLANLRPGFVRFPGGCIVEGRRLPLRYQWKATIGPVEERRVLINRWNDEFRHRPAPDYFQSFGLGFFEFFQLCEDIGAQPLPILNCGMACQFNSGELVPLDALGPYVQDALDLVEFANGPEGSEWGRRRAGMGHPAPFGMKLLGVGNEQWGPEYIERYKVFAKALQTAHPEVRLVSSAGPSPADERFAFAWKELRALKADIVDEHCYDRPDWFFGAAGRFDRYERSGPKVFMGEYAAQSVKTVSPDNRSTWECALSEAAFMTGLERNADVVEMSSYAPLLAHADGWQWKPNLIWFDNLRVLGTASYHVQAVFARNRADVVLPVEVEGDSERLYVSAGREGKTGEVILKAVNARPKARRVSVQIEGASAEGTALATRLVAARDAENTFETPARIEPAARQVPVAAALDLELAPDSLEVLRIRTR